MIKANELRIGNIVTVHNPEYHPKLLNIPLMISGIAQTISSLDRKPTFSIHLEHLNQDSNTYYESYSQFIKFIEPIPLTEEVLLKCGFQSNGSRFMYLNGSRLTFGIDHIEFDYISFRTCLFELGCKYLHQLQNVYFALTGQELEITL